MAKLFQFWQGHPKPAFFEKVQRGDKGKFLKIRPKSSPRLKGPKAHWRKLHYPVISIHLKCKDWRRFWRIRRLQKRPNSQVMAIFARSPRPAFSKKGQTRDQGKSFKNRPKGSARLKGPKALLRKWHYSFIFMHLNCKDWKRFLSKQAAPKVLECPSYGNLGKVTQNQHFLKKFKRGTKTNFSKIAQKTALT